MEHGERGTTMSKNLKEKNKLFSSAAEVKNKLSFYFTSYFKKWAFDRFLYRQKLLTAYKAKHGSPFIRGN